MNRLRILCACASLAGCAETNTCDLSFQMGLSASVKDTSGSPVCDVSIEIREGSYSEQKQLGPTDCTFSGAGERPGIYLVSASRNGTVVASERVTVDADDCHVKHESVTLVVE